MATYNGEGRRSYSAAMDLTANRYKAVKLASDTSVTAITAATDIPIGILNNKARIGELCDVTLVNGDESFLMLAAGTITRGSLVYLAADGRAVAAATGNRAIGRALTNAVAGDIFQVQGGIEVAP